MSKRLLFPSVKAKLLHTFTTPGRRRSVEVWSTTCIVTNFRLAQTTALISPSNPQLCGVRDFSYFPKGGPLPKTKPSVSPHHIMPHVSYWGGIDVREGILYPELVIDGIVHALGGWRLKLECRWKELLAPNGEPCPVGHAVETGVGGQLKDEYQGIIHTTPPFYKYHKHPHDHLASCYKNALAKAFESHARVAIPLLGAGGRGFPAEEAVEVAGKATREWCTTDSDTDQTLVFGLLESMIAHDLAEQLHMHNGSRGS